MTWITTPTHLWHFSVPTAGAEASESVLNTKSSNSHLSKKSRSSIEINPRPARSKRVTPAVRYFPMPDMPSYALNHQEREPEAQRASR